MQTFRQFQVSRVDVPVAIAWYLADLEDARQEYELLRQRSPHSLESLREDALVEGSVSSNRIEGVTVDPSRVPALLSGDAEPRDRNEEEVRGYRDALVAIHQQYAHAKEPVSLRTIRDLHRFSRGAVGDAGEFKTRDADIIECYPDGAVRVRFRPVSAAETPPFVSNLVEGWNRCLEERWVHPLIALGAFGLDFLCIHPFRDGNGRVSRLLLILQSCLLGDDVCRSVSLERLIEENLERYYETLEASSREWHEGRHDPWPYIGYVLFILKEAYRECLRGP